MENNTLCCCEDNHWWFASRTPALLSIMDRVLSGRDYKMRVGGGAGDMIHHLSFFGIEKGVGMEPRRVAVTDQRGYNVWIDDTP